MAVTLAVNFPLGRYHATAWDRNVNEGAVEWPPSPWRLLRALVSTWYTRWPSLPAPELDGLLASLGSPPSYRTPLARPGHTRHYLPDTEHKKGETGSTDLVLDSYLSVPRTVDLLVWWDIELPEPARQVLAKLVELVPYLGRAESVCQARLLERDETPDETWWRPCQPGAAGAVRLLAPTEPVSRPVLEASTVDVRRARRTLPAGTRWVPYRAPTDVGQASSRTGERAAADHGAADRGAADRGAGERGAGERGGDRTITAVRYAVCSQAPFQATHGVLLADAVHYTVARRLDDACVPVDVLLGRAGAATDHQHAHWVPVADQAGTISSIVLWVPVGLTTSEVAKIVDLTGERPLNGRIFRPDSGYRGFPETRLLLQAAGSIETVAPELCGPSRTWRSRTPYLPVQHRRRRTLDGFLTADVRRELEYRGRLSVVTVTRTAGTASFADPWALRFRRYRLRESLAQSRPGLGLHLEFADEVPGPLLLGGLSHFGFGIFAPA